MLKIEMFSSGINPLGNFHSLKQGAYSGDWNEQGIVGRLLMILMALLLRLCERL